MTMILKVINPIWPPELELQPWAPNYALPWAPWRPGWPEVCWRTWPQYRDMSFNPDIWLRSLGP